MPVITVDFPEQSGIEMHYSKTGTGSPPIVFVHGFACAGGDWDLQEAAFKPSNQVVTCDLPGHGESTRQIAGCRVEHLGRAVGAMLVQENLTNAYLVGHSMGCRVVMQAALDEPDRVDGLIFVDGSWIGQGNPDELEAMARAPFEQGGFEPTVEMLFKEMFLDDAVPARASAVVERAQSLDAALGTNLFASLVAWDAKNMERALETFKCKLMAIQSTFLNAERRRVPIGADDSTPWLDLLKTKVPTARVDIVPGVGHFTMFEADQAVNRLIREFIDAD